MIDPRKVTQFDRTQAELEEFLLFSIVVAGKNAFQQAKKLEEFLAYRGDLTPFGYIRWLDSQNPEYLDRMLRQVKMGQYERIGTAFRGIANFFCQPMPPAESLLKNIPISLMESVKGIGMKTSRFFAMHTRPDQQYACLDTHILQWLGERGHEVPKTTPRGQKYLWLEQAFLAYCRELNTTPANLDLQIWNSKHEIKAS